MTLASRLGLAALLATLAACSSHLDGNGVYAERTFDAAEVPAFDHLVLDLPADEAGEPVKASVFARQVPREVVVSGDQNLVDRLRLWVEGGRLRARLDVGSYTVVHPLQLRVQAPDLTGLAASEGAQVTAQGARADDFEVAGSGGARLALSGPGGSALHLALAGGAALDASGYPVAAAEVALTGAARATVWSTGPATGTVDGAGTALVVVGGGGCGLTPTGGATCGAAGP